MKNYFVMRANKPEGYMVIMYDPGTYEIGDGALGTFTADTPEEVEEMGELIYNDWKYTHSARAARETSRKGKEFTELSYEQAIKDIFEIAEQGLYKVVYFNVAIEWEVQNELENDGYRIHTYTEDDLEITTISW